MASEATLHPLVLPTLERTPRVLRAMLDGLPEETIITPGAEGWSPRDVVAHLLSIHYAANVQRVKWMLDADDPVVPNVDEDETLEKSGMREWQLSRLLDEYAAARGEAMVWLCVLTPQQLGRTGRHAVAGSIKVVDVMHHIAFHDLLHVDQIARLLYAPVEARRSAMGAAFPPA